MVSGRMRLVMMVLAVAMPLGVVRGDPGRGRVGTVAKLDVADAGQETVVRIRGTQTPTFTVYKLERPERIVVDVAGTRLTASPGPRQINAWAVSQVSVEALGDVDAAVTRVVVGMARPGAYRVRAEGNDVVVTVVARDPRPAAGVDAVELAKARGEIDAARKDAAEARSAREAEAARARGEAERLAKAAAEREAEAQAARQEAARAKADADRATRGAKDRETQMGAAAEKATREAELAKQEAARLRSEAEAAKREAEVAKREAAKKDAELERTRKAGEAREAELARAGAVELQKTKQMEAELTRARQAAAERAAELDKQKQVTAEAQREAQGARDAASKARADADRRTAEAEAKLGEAAKTLAAADGARREAETTRQQAEAARTQAEKARAEAQLVAREAEAKRAQAEATQRSAEQRRVEAERAAQAALARAKQAEAAGDADATRRRREAEEAVRAADARRKEVEQATALAEARRRDAESKRTQAEGATKEADTRRMTAESAIKEAETKRLAVEGAAREAELRRQQADSARAQADDRRVVAEKTAAELRAEGARLRAQAEEAAAARRREEERAAVVAQRRLDEEQKAKRAAEARAVEEAAAAKATETRRDAEQKRREAEAAALAAGEARKQAESAQAAAETRRKQALAAAADAEAVERKKGATLAEIEAARAEAARLELARRSAETELAARRREVQTQEARAKAEAAQRDQATADMARATKELDGAREARTAEEKRRQDASRAAEKEEARLADAKAKRVAEEKALAELKRTPPPETTKPVAPPPVVVVAKAPPVIAAPPVAAARVRIKDIDFVDRNEAAHVVIVLDGAREPQVLAGAGKQVVLTLAGAELAPGLERSLDTSAYGGPVRAVHTFRDPNDAARVRIVVDLVEPVKGALTRTGTTWTWAFPKPIRVAAAPPMVKPIAKASPIVGSYGAATTPVTSQTVAQTRPPPQAQVRERRITLDAVNIDIHNFMRFLSQAGDVDIVVPDEVKAAVTVRLTAVPWRQAMEVVLQSKGLWYTQDGRILRVAARKDLDAEEQAERERSRAKVQEERPETIVFTLNYAKAAEVQKQITPLLSPRGKAQTDTRTNSMVITDIAGNRAAMLALLKRLDTQTPQIQIEARVVEARTNWSRNLGIQWGFSSLNSAATGNPTGLRFPSTVGVGGGATDDSAPLGGLLGGAADPNFAVNLPAAVGTGAGGAVGFTFGSLGGNLNISLRLSAAEESGTVRIISAPKITVLNNRQASISQGVSIPVSVVSAAGTQTSFMQADLKLATTPTVSQRDCSIQLEIEVTKNEPDFVNTGARGDPSILRKEARTTMIIGDGETSVIGGIYTRNSGLSYSKVPFFADIPIIGWFFKNRSEVDERTEVLIFLTPRITNRATLACEPPPRR
jgi:type IV pilus assembly protein PilQ